MVRTAAKAIVSVSHFLAWASSAIVVGISGYYLARYPHDMRQIFYMIVGASMLAFWLPSYILPFLKSYRGWYLPMNFIWSYLWLTAFIFAAEAYNRHDCRAWSPFGGRCSLKYALEAFIFLAFFFTIAALAGDVFNIKPEEDNTRTMEKDIRHSNATGDNAA